MDIAIIVALITIAGGLLYVLANHRLNLWRIHRREYRDSYTTFKSSFDYAIQQLKAQSTTLNVLILSEYPKHEAAASVFKLYLKGKQKKSFQDKWAEYELIYGKLKSMGPAWVAATTAIIPADFDGRPTPEDLRKFEKARADYLYCILNDILKAAEIKKYL